MKYEYLSHYIDDLISQGELIFSKASVMEKFDKTDAAVRNSIKRQVKAKRLIPLMRGIYLILPLEYKKLGFVPPELFIDDLMKLIHMPYYVGLTSAAGYFGATHQASQLFQVMVKGRLKPILLGRTKIVFYHNTQLDVTQTTQLKTDRGPLVISTPEATIFDMLRYSHQSGNLNFVSTLFDELAENIDGVKLKGVAQNTPLVYVQRAGYLFEFLGHRAISSVLEEVLKKEKPRLYVPLRAGKNAIKETPKNQKWYLIINEKVEPDQ